MASFQLLSPDKPLRASGIKRELRQGPANTLASRAASFFAQLEDGPDLLVGALPFNRKADDYLYQPVSVETGEKARSAPGRPGRLSADKWIVTADPSAELYAAAVSRALEVIAESGAKGGLDPLSKVVLSRSLLVRASQPVDGEALLGKLSVDPSITAFCSPLPSEAGMQPVLIGATPELLVSRVGDMVVSHPLAGSARRYADRSADLHSARELEESDKNRREHNAVVEAVSDTLGPYCSQLDAPDGTTLRATATMWHLGTRIVGRLRDPDTPVTELAAALHPTPAVCGLPREPADSLIHELEGYDRGFYAGAVGWANAQGDGEWYVALRCAQLSGAQVRLYAGAGIVRGSDPLAEVDETSAKFLTMLNALGVDEQGRPLKEQAA